MHTKKYQKMIDDIIETTHRKGIHVIISPELSNEAVPCSSAEISAVIMSQGLLDSNKESAYMMCHEIAHLAAGDRDEEYEDSEECKEYCENTANLSALFLLLGSYTKVYKKYDYEKAMSELYIPSNFKYYVIDILEDYELRPYKLSMRYQIFREVGLYFDSYINGLSSFKHYKYASEKMFKLI